MAPDLLPVWVHDLPVCFPTRPCADYSPYEADLINLTSSLTPASAAIGTGCFVLLGIAVVLIAVGLRPQRPRVGLWVVAVSAAVTVVGIVVADVTDVRAGAISAIYGLQYSAGPEFYGSWWLVSLAGEAMTACGLVALVTTATVAVLRLRAAHAGS